MPTVKGGGSGTKQGVVVGNKLNDLDDVTVAGNEIKFGTVKGIITSRKMGGYKRVVSLMYDPVSKDLIVEYEDT